MTPDCYVIAELGHNHQGSLEKARQLIHAAADCGVDAVKVQKRDNRSLFTRVPVRRALRQREQLRLHLRRAPRGARARPRRLSRSSRRSRRELGLAFFSTAFDEASADLLEELGMPAYKIASGDLRNTPLLRHVAAFGKPMIVSTGGATLEDVDRAVETVLPLNPQLCLLQCTAAYPVEVEELNLGVITTYRERYPGVVVGLSDHQDGIAMALVAHMLGARVIEKHFTLSHSWKGTDHAFSLMPEGMRKLVRDLQRVPDAIGDGTKRPLPSEAKPLVKMGKKLVAARDLPAGHVLAPGDLVAKSPADEGLPPASWRRCSGARSHAQLAEDEAIRVRGRRRTGPTIRLRLTTAEPPQRPAERRRRVSRVIRARSNAACHMSRRPSFEPATSCQLRSGTSTIAPTGVGSMPCSGYDEPPEELDVEHPRRAERARERRAQRRGDPQGLRAALRVVDREREGERRKGREDATEVVPVRTTLDLASEQSNPGCHHDREFRPLLERLDQPAELVGRRREVGIVVADDRCAVVDRAEQPDAHRLCLAAVPLERQDVDVRRVGLELAQDRERPVARAVVDEQQPRRPLRCQCAQGRGIEAPLLLEARDHDDRWRHTGSLGRSTRGAGAPAELSRSGRGSRQRGRAGTAGRQRSDPSLDASRAGTPR